MTTEQIVANYFAGAEAVKAVKVGDTFYGSMGAAERAGGDKFWELGYRHGLPKVICTDANGVITKWEN